MLRQFSGWLGIILLLTASTSVLATQSPPATEEISVIVGRSTIVQTPWPTARVAVTDPNAAYVQALTPDQVLVQGFRVGRTDLILWSEDEQRTCQRRLVVHQDLDTIRSTLKGMFPACTLEVSESGEILIVHGEMRNVEEARHLEEYLKHLREYLGGKKREGKSMVPYVNMTTVSGAQKLRPDLVAAISKALDGMFPTAVLDVNEANGILLVRGTIRSADDALHLKEYLERLTYEEVTSESENESDPVPAMNIALPGMTPIQTPGLRGGESRSKTTTEKKIPYVNMTTLAGVQQVQLQVRVAEVNRAAMKTLGINAFYAGSKSFFAGQRVGSATGGPIVPQVNIGPASGQPVGTPWNFVTPDTGIGASPLVTIFAGFPRSNLEFFFQALAENQYMRILANPTLIAMSGEEATFLAGGEFPIPVVQGQVTGGSTAITIQYKEFGVRLIFRPMVLGENGIRLRAMQEVSELSDVGALVIEGFSVPALRSRRAEATMELRSGQSFAMAGLLQNSDSALTSRIPGLGDLPVLGPLFRSVQYRNNETELVILVTASLVAPLSVNTAPPLPGATYMPPNDWELYIEGRIEGKEPARLDPASAAWLKTMGLDQLAGPGAWDSYEGESSSAAAGSVEATNNMR